MFINERHQKILDIIEKNGRITVEEIQKSFDVSSGSARRDLRILEQEELLKRTYGGAIRSYQVRTRPAMDSYDLSSVPQSLINIALRAIEVIRENDSIFLGGAILHQIIADYLPKDKDITIVTNSVHVAQKTVSYTNIDTFVLGGKYRQNIGVSSDSCALDMVSKLKFDKCFITGVGYSFDCGLSNMTLETAIFQKEIMLHSTSSYCLMPSVKIGKAGFAKVCNPGEIDYLVTDHQFSSQDYDLCEELGVKIILAN